MSTTAPTAPFLVGIDVSQPRWTKALENATYRKPRITPIANTDANVIAAYAVAGSSGAPYTVLHHVGHQLHCGCDACQHGRPCYHVAAVALYEAGMRPLDYHVEPASPRVFYCAVCGWRPVSAGKYLCPTCAEASLDEWRTRHAAAVAALPAIQESSAADVAEARVLHAETLAELPDILAAERNARARQGHTFVPDSTELVSTFEW
jgi:xanthine dehydrogenase iron-sulfur cluster and FAD-binding subunit A